MPAPALKRFWAKVDKNGPVMRPELGPCWVWTGRKKKGYGYLMVAWKDVRAHRFSYAVHLGPIPPGKLACHRCDNPPCVRPSHLFAGTISDNARDSFSKGRRHSPKAGKTHCPAGHPYAGRNLYQLPNGGRVCRECTNAASRRWRARQ